MNRLAPVTSDNWRALARVRPTDDQQRWVADVTFYLCLSAYDGLWRSCAVLDDGGAAVGHVMWAVDPDDDSHWIGGLVIDAHGASAAYLVCVLAGGIAALAAQALHRTPEPVAP